MQPALCTLGASCVERESDLVSFMRQAPAISSAFTPSSSIEDSFNALPFRQAPLNIEAEQALLGAVLINNESFDRVSGFLHANHFFEPLHGRLFEVMAKLIQAGKHASPITLKTFFDSEPPIGQLTVAQYLGRLAANATTIINAEAYGRTIYDLAIRRELIIVGEDMVNLAYDLPVDAPPEKQIEESEQRLFDLADKGKYGSGFMAFGQATVEAVEMAARAYERDGGLSGLSSGLRDLDQMMGGLQNSDLIILAGRPSMGKTALATNIAFNIAKAHRMGLRDGVEETVDGAIVGFFSLEMSSEQKPATRILAEQAQLPSEKIRRGKITPGGNSSVSTRPRRSCKRCRSSSTIRAAYPSHSLRREPGGLSGKRALGFSWSTIFSSSLAQPNAHLKAACRRFPKSLSA